MRGKLTISRTQSNRNGDKIKIEFIDDDSNITFAIAEMSPETFALAVTGLSHLDVDITVAELDKVGKQRQYKHVQIALTTDSYSPEERYENLKQNAASQEVDGWTFNLSKWAKISPHNLITSDGKIDSRVKVVDVPFVRYV